MEIVWRARVRPERLTWSHTAPFGASLPRPKSTQSALNDLCVKLRRVRPREPFGTNPGSLDISTAQTTRSKLYIRTTGCVKGCKYSGYTSELQNVIHICASLGSISGRVRGSRFVERVTEILVTPKIAPIGCNGQAWCLAPHFSRFQLPWELRAPCDGHRSVGMVQNRSGSGFPTTSTCELKTTSDSAPAVTKYVPPLRLPLVGPGPGPGLVPVVGFLTQPRQQPTHHC